MPEYLAPAVYVEEIDSGNKPIEGVSTSTAGMIGVTERGPANVPILVTSYGEYVRWFGERLNRADFGDHCYLPHAVDGFFTNGGFQMLVSGTAGNSYALQASTDLRTWTSLNTNVATSNVFKLFDPGASGSPYRFYRAVELH